MTPIDKLVAERGSTHGDLNDNARLTWSIMRLFMAEPGWEKLNDTQRHGLYMAAAHKPARILCGDPNFSDHWRDMAGYATAVADRLPVYAVMPARLDIHDDKLGPDEVFKSGTPEDGGHHEPYPINNMIDGLLTPPNWNHIVVEYRNTKYYNVDRDYYSNGAIEHLPKLASQLNNYEFTCLPWKYKDMYEAPISENGTYNIKPQYINNWT